MCIQEYFQVVLCWEVCPLFGVSFIIIGGFTVTVIYRGYNTKGVESLLSLPLFQLGPLYISKAEVQLGLQCKGHGRNNLNADKQQLLT